MSKISFRKVNAEAISEESIKEITGLDAADLLATGKINSKEDLMKCIEVIDIEGLKNEAKEHIEKVNNSRSYAIENGGFIALGYDGDCNVIWSNRRSCIARITGASDRLKLKSLFGAAWIEQNFIKINGKGEVCGINWEELNSAIAEECSDAGVYSDDMVRGAGVWINENDQIVVNSGELEMASGEKHERIGSHVYSKEFNFGSVFEYEAATNEEVAELYNAMGSFNFKQKSDLNFIFGFMSASFLCGSLEWRPHLCLTGKRATGKSTMDNIFANVFGKYALHIEGDSSEAGIRQHLGFDARPVIIDEFGAEDDSKSSQLNTAKVIRLMRSACSNMGTGTLRGTAGGEGTSFNVKFMAMISGTTPPPFTAADSSRIVTIELNPVSQEGKERGLPVLLSDRRKLQELGMKMFRRMVENYESFSINLESFRKVLMSGGTARAADTLGTLLAATATMLAGRKLSEIEVAAIMKEVALETHNEDQNHLDEADVLEHLLSTMIQYEVEEKNHGKIEKNRMNQNVKNMIRDVVRGSETTAFVLGQHGIRVEVKDSNVWVFISSSKKHVQLNKLFSGTRWASGGWGKQLNRIEAAEYGTKRIDGNSTKCTGVIIEI